MSSNQEMVFQMYQNSSSYLQQEIEQEEDEQNADSYLVESQTVESQKNNWINLYSQDNIDAKYQDNELRRIENYAIIPKFPKESQTINLFNGLLITDDGAVRYTTALDTVSFGFHQQRVEKVEDIKRLNIIDVKYMPDRTFHQNSFSEAYNFVYHSNMSQFHEISNTLQVMQSMLEYQSNYCTREFDIQFLKEKDEEYLEFISFCFQYLEAYVNQNPNQMFKYSIERVNLRIQDPEITHTGYSKSFLELIGLDNDSLNQLVCRNKRIDLLTNKLDISTQTIRGMSDLEAEKYPTTSVMSYIITFDGFPIRLYQKQTVINHGFKSKLIYRRDCEYSFCISEMDVDVYDLEQLIQYRQNLVNNQSNMNFDNFIRKELSYLFEDVEYSVHSQNFIEQFYTTNLKSLKELRHLEKQKIKQKYQSCQFKSIKS